MYVVYFEQKPVSICILHIVYFFYAYCSSLINSSNRSDIFTPFQIHIFYFILTRSSICGLSLTVIYLCFRNFQDASVKHLHFKKFFNTSTTIVLFVRSLQKRLISSQLNTSSSLQDATTFGKFFSMHILQEKTFACLLRFRNTILCLILHLSNHRILVSNLSSLVFFNACFIYDGLQNISLTAENWNFSQQIKFSVAFGKNFPFIGVVFNKSATENPFVIR